MLDAIVNAFLDVLIARPSFVPLVEREATAGGATLATISAETAAVQSGLATLARYLAHPAFRAAMPASTLLSLLAPRWLPIAHAETFVRGLGSDPESPGFLPAWKRHVADLALRGLVATQGDHR